MLSNELKKSKAQIEAIIRKKEENIKIRRRKSKRKGKRKRKPKFVDKDIQIH